MQFHHRLWQHNEAITRRVDAEDAVLDPIVTAEKMDVRV